MPAQPLNRICYVEDDEDIQRIVRMSLERIVEYFAFGQCEYGKANSGRQVAK